MSDFVVALGLVLAIEGMLYAAAPAIMRRAVENVLETPEPVLRFGGLGAAVVGVLLVWVVRG